MWCKDSPLVLSVAVTNSRWFSLCQRTAFAVVRRLLVYQGNTGGVMSFFLSVSSSFDFSLVRGTSSFGYVLRSGFESGDVILPNLDTDCLNTLQISRTVLSWFTVVCTCRF